MSNTFSSNGIEPTITIERKRYEELVKKEEKLKLLSNALNGSTYWEIAKLNAVFNAEEKKGTTV